MRSGGYVKLKKNLRVNLAEELGPYLGYIFRALVLQEHLGNYKPKNRKFDHIHNIKDDKGFYRILDYLQKNGKIEYLDIETSEKVNRRDYNTQEPEVRLTPTSFQEFNKMELLLLDIEDKLRKEGHI